MSKQSTEAHAQQSPLRTLQPHCSDRPELDPNFGDRQSLLYGLLASGGAVSVSDVGAAASETAVSGSLTAGTDVCAAASDPGAAAAILSATSAELPTAAETLPSGDV